MVCDRSLTTMRARETLRSGSRFKLGHTRGITVPNPDAQAKLIRRTYQDAGLDFARTGYFEAHVNQPLLCP